MQKEDEEAGKIETANGEEAEVNEQPEVEEDENDVEEEEEEEEGEGVGEDEYAGLSKKERKRKANMQRYLEKRKQRRLEEKERKKEKRNQIRAAGLGETLKKRPKPKLMKDSACKLRLAVDMSFDSLMSDKDRRRCIAQLGWCYSANRKAPEPVQYHVVAFEGPSRAIFDQNGTYANWDVALDGRPLEECFAKEDIVYLSAESENVLSTLDDTKAYIIGGLVDHNSHKGICHRMAVEKGFTHARLPIDEFVSMQTRRVLTVNHVFEIMLLFWQTRNWESAFFTVIPKRKGAAPLEKDPETKADDTVKAEVVVEKA